MLITLFHSNFCLILYIENYVKNVMKLGLVLLGFIYFIYSMFKIYEMIFEDCHILFQLVQQIKWLLPYTVR